MSVYESDSTRGQVRGSVSYPNFADWREQNQVFERLASYHSSDFTLTGRGDSARLQGAVVNADLFPLLGVAPTLGRSFSRTRTSRATAAGWSCSVNNSSNNASMLIPTSSASRWLLMAPATPSSVLCRRDFQFPIQNDPVDLWTTVAVDRKARSPSPIFVAPIISMLSAA